MTLPLITADQIAAAISRFDRELRNAPEWEGWERSKAHRYAIRSDGRLYPVKQIVSLAAGLPVSSFSGGQQANAAVAARGFTIETIGEPEDTVEGVESALQKLILEDEALAELEDGLSELNIFEAIGAVRSELRHSDFLSFLLDPLANHGLRDLFLKRFAQRVVLSANGQALVSALELGVWDLEGSRVERESDDIDILIVNEENRLAIVIENKVDSTEHSNQLARYYDRITSRHPGYRCLFVYLSVDGAAASHPSYVALSYGACASWWKGFLKADQIAFIRT